MKSPQEIRTEIDLIDDQITDLFLKRMAAAKDIAETKRTAGMPILNAKREEEILNRISAKVGPTFAKDISLLYNTLFSISRNYQERLPAPLPLSPNPSPISHPEIAIIGLGLIGGSLFKAAQKANYHVVGFDKGDKLEIATCDIIFVALPPSAAIEWIQSHSSLIKRNAILVDTAGIKTPIFNAFIKSQKDNPRFFIVPAHPMAGKEQSGFANSDPNLFKNASMILTPFHSTPPFIIQSLKNLFSNLGFAKTIISTPTHHDTQIAYTSQLCHIISSAYLRDPLALNHLGFSAGSFRDMIRVGAPAPDLWTELFSSNKDALLPVLSRFINRLIAFQSAIENNSSNAIRAQLSEGLEVKKKLNEVSINA